MTTVAPFGSWASSIKASMLTESVVGLRDIERPLEAELYFYSRVFGFDPADDLTPIPIAHEEAL